MKTTFFLSLIALAALNAEYVAEIQVTKVTDENTSEVVMNSTLVIEDGQQAIVTVGDEGQESTTIEMRISSDE